MAVTAAYQWLHTFLWNIHLSRAFQQKEGWHSDTSHHSWIICRKRCTEHPPTFFSFVVVKWFGGKLKAAFSLPGMNMLTYDVTCYCTFSSFPETWPVSSADLDLPTTLLWLQSISSICSLSAFTRCPAVPCCHLASCCLNLIASVPLQYQLTAVTKLISNNYDLLDQTRRWRIQESRNDAKVPGHS